MSNFLRLLPPTEPDAADYPPAVVRLGRASRDNLPMLAYLWAGKLAWWPAEPDADDPVPDNAVPLYIPVRPMSGDDGA